MAHTYSTECVVVEKNGTACAYVIFTFSLEEGESVIAEDVLAVFEREGCRPMEADDLCAYAMKVMMAADGRDVFPVIALGTQVPCKGDFLAVSLDAFNYQEETFSLFINVVGDGWIGGEAVHFGAVKL